MKISNCLNIFVLLLILSIHSEPVECPAVVVPCQQAISSTNQQPTILTFYIESDVEQEEDFIEMFLTVKEKDTSLKKAIDKIGNKVASIRSLCEDYCIRNGGEDCEARVDISKFKVEPSYQVVRRQPNFIGFVVTNSITIIVLETDDLGVLVDGLLGLGVYQMEQLEWKPYEEVDSTQIAIDAGIRKGKQLCKHINRKMGMVLSIEEVFFEDEDDDKKQDQASPKEEEEDDKNEHSLLQFKIECIGVEQKVKTAKKSKEDKDSKDKKKNDEKVEKKKK